MLWGHPWPRNLMKPHGFGDDCFAHTGILHLGSQINPLGAAAITNADSNLGYVPPPSLLQDVGGVHRKVSVDIDTATGTQTLKWGREVGNPAGDPRKTTKNSEHPQKLRDSAPTYLIKGDLTEGAAVPDARIWSRCRSPEASFKLCVVVVFVACVHCKPTALHASVACHAHASRPYLIFARMCGYESAFAPKSRMNPMQRVCVSRLSDQRRLCLPASIPPFLI